jgi:hypothetical protein
MDNELRLPRFVFKDNKVIMPEDIGAIYPYVEALEYGEEELTIGYTNARKDHPSPWCYVGTEQRIYENDLALWGKYSVFITTINGLWIARVNGTDHVLAGLYDLFTFTSIKPWEEGC